MGKNCIQIRFKITKLSFWDVYPFWLPLTSYTVNVLIFEVSIFRGFSYINNFAGIYFRGYDFFKKKINGIWTIIGIFDCQYIFCQRRIHTFIDFPSRL